MKHATESYNRIQDPAGVIPVDEPVFMLRGSDVLAYETVLFWCKRAREIGVDEERIKAVEAHAESIAQWPVKMIPGT